LAMVFLFRQIASSRGMGLAMTKQSDCFSQIITRDKGESTALIMINDTNMNEEQKALFLPSNQ
jgi:hypothetical protein